MASSKHTIEIAGQAVEVPAWASEEQLKELIAIDKGNLASLSALLQNNKAVSSRQIAENKRLLGGVKQAIDRGTKEGTKEDQKIFKSLRDLISVNKLQAAINKKAKDIEEKQVERLNDAVKSMGSSIKKTTKDLSTGIDKSDLKGIASAIGSIAGIGAVTGFAVGVIEGFAKNLTELSNTGVGLTTSLQNLRGDAADAGLDLASYGKIVNGNSRAIKAMGSSTDDGARNFAALSKQLRHSARDVGQFGLSNTEYNEILAEEIEIRRRGGMSQAQITESVNKSMNELMSETTALASITGQDRREMLRNRSAIMSDPIIETARQQFAALGKDLPANIGNLGSIIGGLGDEGAVFAGALAQAAVTDIPFFSTALGSQLKEMISVGGPEIQGAFADIAKFADDNALTMPTEEFNTKITAMMGRLGDVATPEVRQNLMSLGATGVESATKLLGFVNGLQGIATSEKAINDARKDVDDGLEKNKEFLGLSNSLEELSNNVKASSINTVFDTIGTSLSEDGAHLSTAIRKIGDRFGADKTLGEGVGVGGALGIGALITAIAALTIGVNALTTAIAVKQLGGGFGGGTDVDRKNKTKPRVKPRGKFGKLFELGRRGASFIGDKLGSGGRAVAGAGTAVVNSVDKTKVPGMGNVAKSALRRFAPVATLLGAVDAGSALMNDDLSTTEKSEEVGGAVGGVGGGLAGMAAGAAIGSILPGPGTVIGGILGGIIGSFAGDFVGSKAGEAVGEKLSDNEIEGLDSEIEKTNKEIQDLQARIDRSVAGQNEFWGKEEGGQRKAKAEITKLEEHLATLTERAKTPKELPTVPTSTVLATQSALQKQSAKNNSALAAFEESAGEKIVVGREFDGMEGRDVDVMGYADPEKQAKYKELSKKKFKAQAQLRKLERSDRYKIARANELAKEMGIDTGDGNVKFTAEGHVPTVINGKAVDQSLLTEREKQKIGAAQEMRSAFEGRKTSSLQTDPVTETANPAIKQAELNNPNTTPLSQAQGEAIIAELKENNRLSRKQTDTIENTA